MQETEDKRQKTKRTTKIQKCSGKTGRYTRHTGLMCGNRTGIQEKHENRRTDKEKNTED